MEKTNYENQPIFKTILEQIKNNNKLNEITDLKNMEENKDLTLMECIEAKIFPSIDAKIFSKSKARFESLLER